MRKRDGKDNNSITNILPPSLSLSPSPPSLPLPLFLSPSLSHSLVETTALDSKTAVTGMGPAAPTASAGNEPDPTAPLNNCPHHFPVEPATCTCSNVSLCCYGCISERIRDLQAHFDGKIKAVCADFHSKLEDVQTENARLLDLVKKIQERS